MSDRQRFEWSAEKRAVNLAKHGVDFADVLSVFDDPYALTYDSYRNGEQRWSIIGLAFPRVVFVVYTERAGDTIRIISARKATSQERQLYEQHL